MTACRSKADTANGSNGVSMGNMIVKLFAHLRRKPAEAEETLCVIRTAKGVEGHPAFLRGEDGLRQLAESIKSDYRDLKKMVAEEEDEKRRIMNQNLIKSMMESEVCKIVHKKKKGKTIYTRIPIIVIRDLIQKSE